MNKEIERLTKSVERLENTVAKKLEKLNKGIEKGIDTDLLKFEYELSVDSLEENKRKLAFEITKFENGGVSNAQIIKFEELVDRLIKQQLGYEIQGYINECWDDKEVQFPTIEELQEMIYNSVMQCDGIYVGQGFIPVKKNIRFLTTERINQLIAVVLNNRYDKYKNEAYEGR